MASIQTLVCVGSGVVRAMTDGYGTGKQLTDAQEVVYMQDSCLFAL